MADTKNTIVMVPKDQGDYLDGPLPKYPGGRKAMSKRIGELLKNGKTKPLPASDPED